MQRSLYRAVVQSLRSPHSTHTSRAPFVVLRQRCSPNAHSLFASSSSSSSFRPTTVSLSSLAFSFSSSVRNQTKPMSEAKEHRGAGKPSVKTKMKKTANLASTDTNAAASTAAAAAAAAAADQRKGEGPSIKFIERTTGSRLQTEDPFLFGVYHKDDYPAGDEMMQAPIMGNGSDFDASAPYRMYHGKRIPGFPAHPHRGFETITATIDGLIDHADSAENGGRYGEGDLQWMTAGKGIQHSEMFPLINSDRGNPTRFFQLWINLPKRSKMVDPEFIMHWAEDVTRFSTEDGAHVRVWAGSLGDKVAQPPPKNSWAHQPDSNVRLIYVDLEPGAKFTLDATKPGVKRNLYFMEGEDLTVDGVPIERQGKGSPKSNEQQSVRVSLEPTSEIEMHNHGAAEKKSKSKKGNGNDKSSDANPGMVSVLIMEGTPIGEPVAQHGPFVMNTQREIIQAFEDYRRTEFGGWPWDSTATVWSKEKGRFASIRGVEIHPPHFAENKDANDNKNNNNNNNKNSAEGEQEVNVVDEKKDDFSSEVKKEEEKIRAVGPMGEFWAETI